MGQSIRSIGFGLLLVGAAFTAQTQINLALAGEHDVVAQEYWGVMASKALIYRLGESPESLEEEWEYLIIQSERFEEFVSIYFEKEWADYDKLALMGIILGSMDGHILKSVSPSYEFIADVRTELVREFTLHEERIRSTAALEKQRYLPEGYTFLLSRFMWGILYEKGLLQPEDVQGLKNRFWKPSPPIFRISYVELSEEEERHLEAERVEQRLVEAKRVRLFYETFEESLDIWPK